MRSFADWLCYYNNLDVAPGLEALEKMRTFYSEKGIDILKDAVSISGVSLHYLLQGAVERGAELYGSCKEEYEMLKGTTKLVFQGSGLIESKSRVFAKKSTLRRQRSLPFDNAQRNSVRKGEGRPLRRRVPSADRTCTNTQAQRRKPIRIC